MSGHPAAAFVDVTALRLQLILVGLDATKSEVDLQAKRHIAVLAVALTLAGTVAFSLLTGQTHDPAGGGVLAVLLVIVGAQIRALGRQRLVLRETAAEATRAIGSLIKQEGEQDVDAEEVEPRGS